MKRIIAMMLAALMLIGPALAEGPGATATLTFSSFSGGGYEYAVEIEDPEIVSFEIRYEYEQSDEPIDGGSYDAHIVFTGVRPGSTRATVLARSPILDDDDRVYAVEVDDDLSVRVTPVRAIATFFMSRVIEGGYASFGITLGADGYRVSVDDGPDQPIDAGTVDEVMRAIDAYGVAGWDGFDEADYNVLDGENFRLEIALTDGTTVRAKGDNAFPDNYSAAVNVIWRILSWNTGD